jgi:5'-nucleotidase
MKIVYFDLDGVLADYYSKPNYKDNPDVPEKGFFESLEPLEGAVEAFTKLSKYYNCYFLTTAPWSNVHSLSEKRIWVEKYFGELAFKRLITTHRKDLAKGDYLIDDRTFNGAGEFEGEHINFGTERFPNWESVVNYLVVIALAESQEKHNTI